MKKILYLLPLVVLFGCDPEKETKPDDKNNNNTVNPVVKNPAPIFNEDSAYLFVEKQVSFGPRVPNSQSHQMCAEWMVSELKKSGLTKMQ